MGMEDSSAAVSKAAADQAARQFTAAASRLRAELGTLEHRHQSERKKCFEVWLQKHEEAFSKMQVTADPPPSQKNPPPMSLPAAPSLSFPATLQVTADAPSLPLPSEPSRLSLDSVLSQASQAEKGTQNKLAEAFTIPASPKPNVGLTSIVPAKNAAQKMMARSQTALMGGDKKKKKSKRDFRVVAQTKNVSHEPGCLQKFTASHTYEALSAGLIITNAVLIGYETQYLAELCQDLGSQKRIDEFKPPFSFVVMQIVFCVLFTVELGLRWIADGLFDFFRSSDKWWVFFDVFVVSFSILDVLLMPFSDGDEGNEVLGNISVLRIMRVVRIVRVAKVIRVMKFFKELRQMIFSILGSIKSLIWSLMVLGMLFFIFGISLVTGVTDHLIQPGEFDNAANDNLKKFFGSLDLAILSLYMAMSGGNDWGVYYEALEQIPAQHRALFLVFISFAIFAVVNIVTGVFVNSALNSSNDDREIMIHEELESKKSYQSSMREFFEEADEDGTGTMGFDEFKKKLDDEIVKAYLNAHELDVSDANMLFTLLDYDQSGEIQIEEFLDGCYKLQGQSRALDMKITQMEIKWLREAVRHVTELLSDGPSAIPGVKKVEHHDDMSSRIAEVQRSALAAQDGENGSPPQRSDVVAQREDYSQPCYIEEFDPASTHHDLDD